MSAFVVQLFLGVCSQHCKEGTKVLGKQQAYKVLFFFVVVVLLFCCCCFFLAVCTWVIEAIMEFVQAEVILEP